MKSALFCLLALCAAPAAASDPLAGVSIPSLKLDGSGAGYSLSGGRPFKGGNPLKDGSAEAERVRRLAGFLAGLERRPFFFSIAANAEKLSAAAALLEEKSSGTMKYLGSAEKLYPYAFLRAYAAASAAYAAFAASPSEAGARALLREIKRGVEAYGREAAQIEASVARRFEAINADRLSLLGNQNVTDRATIMKDMALIRANAAAAARKAGELEKCLRTSLAYCGAAWPSAAPGPAPGPRGERPPEFLPDSARSVRGPEPAGPYLADSPCWGGSRENYFFRRLRCDIFKPCMEWSSLATDTYFRLLSDEVPSHERLRKAGYKLIPQDPTGPYCCMNLEYKPALETLHSFLAAFPAPLFPEGRRPPAEEYFYSEKVKSSRALLRLGAEYSAELSRSGPAGPLAGPLLARARHIWENTANFDLILNRLSFHVMSYGMNRTEEGREPDITVRTAGIFLTKNHYSLSFMPFSPSVWMLAERPAYLAANSRPHPGNGSVLNYREALAEFGEGEVERTLADQYEIHSAGDFGRRDLRPRHGLPSRPAPPAP